MKKSGYCRNEKVIMLKIIVLCLSYVVEIIEDRVRRSLRSVLIILDMHVRNKKSGILFLYISIRSNW